MFLYFLCTCVHFYPLLEMQNSSNETTECGDLPNKYYVKIFLTAVAELPGKSISTILEMAGAPSCGSPLSCQLWSQIHTYVSCSIQWVYTCSTLFEQAWATPTKGLRVAAVSVTFMYVCVIYIHKRYHTLLQPSNVCNVMCVTNDRPRIFSNARMWSLHVTFRFSG